MPYRYRNDLHHALARPVDLGVADLDKGRWLALGFAGTAVILTLSTWFSTTAVTPELIQQWDLTTEQAGWLTNAVQIGFVSGALGSSFLSVADIVRLPRLMAAAAIVAALSNGALLLEPGLEGALIARFVTGASLAGIYPPAMKYVSTWFKSARGLALGIMVGALTVGSAAPHLLRGLGAMVSWQTVIPGLFRGMPDRRRYHPVCLTRWPLSVRQCRRRSTPVRPNLAKSARNARELRLLRPYVGALRHVGLVSCLCERGDRSRQHRV